MSEGEQNAFFLDWIMKVLGLTDSDFYLLCGFSHCILGRGNKVSIWSICLGRELILVNSVFSDCGRHALVFKVRKR